jgi:zinc/manganese transport system substrate-binding protein
LGALLVLFNFLSGLGGAQASDGERPRVVATTEMLGWVARELAGDEADVLVLMQGVDPHSWEPSARDVEAVLGADLVVVNGLSLEEGLVAVIEQVEASGVPLFEATDHLALRELDTSDDEGHGPEASEEPDHDHAGVDPHFWLDPLAMRDVAAAMVPALEALGVSAADRGDALARSLEELDAEVGEILAVVPPERRRLVTGHESMGYFADRYGLEFVGAIVPGTAAGTEVSAGELAALVETVRAQGVPAIFTELGTPVSVAQAVADETDATIVELPTEQLPEDGSYLSFMRLLSTRVAEALID